jgi:hypothetical protein
MAAGAFTIYSTAALELGQGTFDLATNNFNFVLVTSNYAPNVSTDSTYANISSTEVPAGSGYTTGGVELTDVSWSINNGIASFTSSPPTFEAFSNTFEFGVIVRRAGETLEPNDLLLCFSDLGNGSSITAGGGSLVITPTPNGIFTLTHNP